MEQETLLKADRIIKAYPGVIALDNVSIDFIKGEVHAIVGENGAGKSTLIKILTGAIQPDSGEIIFEGKSYSSFTAHKALELKISAIYQEFNLIPYLSVAENIFQGRELLKGPFLDIRKMNQQTVELCKDMGLVIDPKAIVKDLGIAYQQIVEIVKAVAKQSKLLIMDEPSAPLTNRETKAMFELMRTLKQRGVTIIYISHMLEEVFEICDRVSVMRDGRYIITKNTEDTNIKELISYMVGRELGDDYPQRVPPVLEETVLEVRGLNTEKIQDISFCLKKGEILGIGGLVGAGRTELVRAIFGADRIHSGEILVSGEKCVIDRPGAAIKAGLALIPEDRKTQGLILGMSVGRNITYCSLKRISSLGFVKKKDEEKISQEFVKELRIKTPGIGQITRNLSGGNQQKVVLAKWLNTASNILIFDEPTRGIDVGAKQEIYSLMRSLVDNGKSIIMISSDMLELLGMSDRIQVMHEGRIVGELQKGSFSQERLLELASGQT